jgi:hypothetical protein
MQGRETRESWQIWPIISLDNTRESVTKRRHLLLQMLQQDMRQHQKYTPPGNVIIHARQDCRRGSLFASLAFTIMVVVVDAANILSTCPCFPRSSAKCYRWNYQNPARALEKPPTAALRSRLLHNPHPRQASSAPKTRCKTNMPTSS